MRPIRGPRFWAGLTAVLGLVIIAGLWLLTVPLADGGATVADASDSGSAPATGTPDGSASPTESAEPVLDSMVLAAAGDGWVLTTAVDDEGTVTVVAIDPSGGTYPGVELAAGTELLAWLADGRAVVFDPETSELYAQVISVDGAADIDPVSFGTGWVDPEVALAADGSVESAVVASGPASARTLDSVDVATGVITALADADRRVGLVSSPDGTSALTGVGSTRKDIVMSGAAGDSSAGTPLGASDCVPAAWDSGRQAIVVCVDDQTTVWALEPTTATYASASVLPTVGDLALAVSGSRILVEGSVYGVEGTLRWELPSDAADATEAVFSGDSLALWSRDDQGLVDAVALVRPTGRLSAVVDVPDGYEGFAQVVGFGPFS